MKGGAETSNFTIGLEPELVSLITQLRDVARLIYHAKPYRLPAVQFRFWHRFGTNQAFKPITEEPYMLQMTDIQHVVLAIAPVDAVGNPAPIQNVGWSTADPTMFTLTPSADGLTCDVASTGKLGQAQINVTGDAHVGATTPDMISGSLEISVTNSEATTLSITAGTPSDIVLPTP